MLINGAEQVALSPDVVEEDGSRFAEITLPKAANTSSQLAISAVFTLESEESENDWSTRDLTFSAPVFVESERTQMDLGIALAESMDATIDPQTGWEGLSSQELQARDLAVPGLAAGLTSSAPGTSPLAFQVARRATRGTYESISYLLASERTLRIRVDLRLAIVDRPVSTLQLRLPTPSETVTVKLLGEGIKSPDALPVASADAGVSVITIPFATPWVGTRQVRLEYEVPHTADSPTPIPSFELESSGVFSATRHVVFQSAGPVELSVSPSGGLEAIDVDDLPELGTPWSEKGVRTLFAFRFRGTQTAPGSFQTAIHPRAPILERMAQELKLTTLISESGVTRTRAENRPLPTRRRKTCA